MIQEGIQSPRAGSNWLVGMNVALTMETRADGEVRREEVGTRPFRKVVLLDEDQGVAFVDLTMPRWDATDQMVGKLMDLQIPTGPDETTTTTPKGLLEEGWELERSQGRLLFHRNLSPEQVARVRTLNGMDVPSLVETADSLEAQPGEAPPADGEEDRIGTLREDGSKLFLDSEEGSTRLDWEDYGDVKLRRLAGRRVRLRGKLTWDYIPRRFMVSGLAPATSTIAGIAEAKDGGITLTRDNNAPPLLLRGHPLLPRLDGLRVWVRGWRFGDEFVVYSVQGVTLASDSLRNYKPLNISILVPVMGGQVAQGAGVAVVDAMALAKKASVRWTRRQPLDDSREGNTYWALVQTADRLEGWFPLEKIQLGVPADAPSESTVESPPPATGLNVALEDALEGQVTEPLPASAPADLEEGDSLEAESQPDSDSPGWTDPRRELPPLPEDSGTHTVARGETLWGIAKKYGDQGVTTTELMVANGKWPPDTVIRPGDVLRIPSVPSRVARMVIQGGENNHWIQEGDSLTRVARIYENVTLEEIRALNPNPGRLKAGDLLKLPAHTSPVGDPTRHQVLTSPE